MELSPLRGNECAEKRESTTLESLEAAHSTTLKVQKLERETGESLSKRGAASR
jgi:hypothetical protein